MENHRWRTFGVAFVPAASLALTVATLETLLAGRSTLGAPGLGDYLYAARLHLAVALAVTLSLRLAFWRAGPERFPAIACAGVLFIELAATGTYWLAKAPGMPPFYTTAGRVLVAAGALAALPIAILAGQALRRSRASASWARAASGGPGRGRLARAGLAWALLVAVAAAVFAAGAWPRAERYAVRPEAEQLERPDVLVILVDTLRRDHLSAFGYSRPTSPHIDRLLAESFRFDAAWTPSTWTIPSVASLFTGLYPSAHGITTAIQRLPEDAAMLAEHFRTYGYRTAAFVGNQIVTGSNGYAQGFERFFPPSAPWWTYHRRTALELIATRLVKPESGAREWRLNLECLRWLKENEGHPRFVYLHYRDPHSPYEPMQQDLDAVAPGAPDGPVEPPVFSEYEARVSEPGCRDWECLTDPPVLAESELEGMIARYDGDIRHVDRRIGDLFAELEAMGFLARAHLLFVNDHGEEFGEHGGWHHGHGIYEEMVGAPIAYRPPGGLAGGRVIARPVPMLDLPVTLCHLLGMEPPPLYQGELVPELLGQAPPRRRAAILTELPPWLYAVRLDRWKLIRRGPIERPDWRLYDLAADPGERSDLAAVWPDTVAMLRGYLEGRLAEVGKVRLTGVSSTMDPELLQQLKALGYIQ